MRVGVVRVMFVAVMLSSLCACTKFKWSTNEQYEIQQLNNKLNENKQPNQELGLEYQQGSQVTAKEGSDDRAIDTGLQTEQVIEQADGGELESGTTSNVVSEHVSERTEEIDVSSVEHDDQFDFTKSDLQASESAVEQEKKAGEVICVDLNHATAEQLMTLPGIGARRAQDIVKLRAKRPFKRKADIKRVKGIGKKTYTKLEKRLCDL